MLTIRSGTPTIPPENREIRSCCSTPKTLCCRPVANPPLRITGSVTDGGILNCSNYRPRAGELASLWALGSALLCELNVVSFGAENGRNRGSGSAVPMLFFKRLHQQEPNGYKNTHRDEHGVALRSQVSFLLPVS